MPQQTSPLYSTRTNEWLREQRVQAIEQAPERMNTNLGCTAEYGHVFQGGDDVDKAMKSRCLCGAKTLEQAIAERECRMSNIDIA